MEAAASNFKLKYAPGLDSEYIWSKKLIMHLLHYALFHIYNAEQKQ